MVGLFANQRNQLLMRNPAFSLTMAAILYSGLSTTRAAETANAVSLLPQTTQVASAYQNAYDLLLGKTPTPAKVNEAIVGIETAQLAQSEELIRSRAAEMPTHAGAKPFPSSKVSASPGAPALSNIPSNGYEPMALNGEDVPTWLISGRDKKVAARALGHRCRSPAFREFRPCEIFRFNDFGVPKGETRRRRGPEINSSSKIAPTNR